METTKNIKLDYHSLFLSERDQVNVIQKAVTEKGEFAEKEFKAFFMGMKQFDTYSPWMYVFAIKNEDDSILMKYIAPHEIKEINYTIKAPSQIMLNETKKETF